MQNVFLDATDPTDDTTGLVDAAGVTGTRDADEGGNPPTPAVSGHAAADQAPTVPVQGTGLVLCVGLDPDQWSSVIRSVNADIAVLVVANTESALRVLVPGGVLPEQSSGRRPHHGHGDDAQDEHGLGGYGGHGDHGDHGDHGPAEHGARGPLALGVTHGRRPPPEPGRGPGSDTRAVVEFGPLRLDHNLREVFWHTRSIELSARQFDLLATLAGAGNRVWTFAELTEAVWRRPYVGDVDAVASAVKRLRRRLQDVTPELAVASVRGVGYRIALVPTTLPVRSDVPVRAW